MSVNTGSQESKSGSRSLQPKLSFSHADGIFTVIIRLLRNDFLKCIPGFGFCGMTKARELNGIAVR
jgi:hypothetical protein